MGYFLAVTAFRTNSPTDVVAAITDYLTTYKVSQESVLSGPPDHDRDLQIYDSVNGWTVVIWPEGFNLYDFPLAIAIGEARGWLVSAIHVNDSEYWEHLAVEGALKLHEYCSRPQFWAEESPSDYDRMMAYDSNVSRLAMACSVPSELLTPYMIDADTVAADSKGHSDDQFTLDDFWVFTDFWNSIGITYPSPGENLASVIRLWRFFANRLPAV
jgi:hypothetical protein